MLSYNYAIESHCELWQRMIFNVVDMGLHIFVVNTFVVNKKYVSIQKNMT